MNTFLALYNQHVVGYFLGPLKRDLVGNHSGVKLLRRPRVIAEEVCNIIQSKSLTVRASKMS